MRRAILVCLVAAALDASAARVRSVRLTPQPAPPANAEPAGCAVPPLAQETCVEGAAGYGSLVPSEVEAVARAAAKALDSDSMTVAVVDRAGRVLALYRKPSANPANDDLAAGVARTAAFFSHNQAPLSSRTVRFLSGIHFPPGITNTASAALYGIENTNRGCDFNTVFNPGKCLPRARRIGGIDCSTADRSGCGPGIVTGKVLPGDSDPASVNAGGIPLYRVSVDGKRVVNGGLVGAIGVVGISGDPQLAEFAAATGAFGSLATGIAPVPFFPLPQPGNVFIDGIRLPFLGPDLRLEFASTGIPSGVRRPDGARAGSDNGTFVIAPQFGGCAANEYLVGPIAGSRLTAAEVDGIVQRAIATAKRTRAAIRLPLDRYARMVIAVGDTDGKLLALYRMPDATVFSVDVAVAKSRNVTYFSEYGLPGMSGGVAVTNRTIAFGSQPFFPSGIDSDVLSPRPGPWYDSLFIRDLNNVCSMGPAPASPNQNGIVFFAGSTPLYRGNDLVGGLGVSGDGIEQDDYVSYFGAGPFLPAEEKWADRVVVDGVRLPMFKFPRHPEGVTECGGGPCD
jgi:uncharacterized protein GlcG (DUF336 family)